MTGSTSDSGSTATPAAESQTTPRGIDLTQDRWLGRYELLFKLARGGMGTVYVARLVGAHGFDKLVAVKLLHDAKEGSAQMRAFLNEARISARIDHANVVQTLELGEHNGIPFIVMELIRGVSLSALQRELRARGERMDPALAAWIIGRAARGLHAAHDLTDPTGEPMNLVHRDVSPQNVLVSYEGRVTVADFGIAKLVDADPTSAGVVKGKFAYMSPEQARAETLDRRSDVFALGIVLHEALTGERLFATESPLTTINNILDMEVKAPHELVDGVPRAISSVTMMCLAKSRDDRFATAQALSDALRNATDESGARVDERALSKLVSDLFAERKTRFEKKVDLAVRQSRAPDDSSQVSVLEAEPTGQGEALARTVEHETPSRRRTWWLAGAVVVVLAAVVWIGQSFESAPTAAPAASVADGTESAEPTMPSATASAHPAPAASPPPAASSARADATASASATASPPARKPPVRRPPTRRPVPKPKPKPNNDVPLFDDIGN